MDNTLRKLSYDNFYRQMEILFEKCHMIIELWANGQHLAKDITWRSVGKEAALCLKCHLETKSHVVADHTVECTHEYPAATVTVSVKLLKVQQTSKLYRCETQVINHKRQSDSPLLCAGKQMELNEPGGQKISTFCGRRQAYEAILWPTPAGGQAYKASTSDLRLKLIKRGEPLTAPCSWAAVGVFNLASVSQCPSTQLRAGSPEWPQCLSTEH